MADTVHKVLHIARINSVTVDDFSERQPYSFFANGISVPANVCMCACVREMCVCVRVKKERVKEHDFKCYEVLIEFLVDDGKS